MVAHQCSGYYLDMVSVIECHDSIPTELAPVVFIPNVFSPNNDMSNDVFRLRGENISQVDIKVYDRWGDLVFATQDINESWTGRNKNKDCPTGVYYYMANISFTNGETIIKRGNVTLLR
jgi:large repetitive protein